MSEGVVVYQSDANVFHSIERWNRVMKALAALYNSYHNESIQDNMLADLDELMRAYDAWLD